MPSSNELAESAVVAAPPPAEPAEQARVGLLLLLRTFVRLGR